MTALRVGFLGDSYRKHSFTRRYQHFFSKPEVDRRTTKNTARFVASLGAEVQPRSTVQRFMPVSGVEKPLFRSFFSALGLLGFRDQQCQFLTRKNGVRSENESNCSMTSECVRTDSILPRGAGLEHGRCKQSIFSVSNFGILVKVRGWWPGTRSSSKIFFW